MNKDLSPFLIGIKGTILIVIIRLEALEDKLGSKGTKNEMYGQWATPEDCS